MNRIERVLVTGASRGIGRAIAEALIDDGRSVIACARDRERLAPLIARAADRCTMLEADLRDPQGIVEQAVAAFDGLDGLVHAAGIAPHAPLDAIRLDELDACYALHVRTPLVLTQDLARHLRATGRPGAIVHIASTLGWRTAPGTAAYSASKAALISLTKTSALELAASGIRVNAVAPGVVDTDMTRALRAGERDPEAQLEGLRALHPLGRLGEPSEIAQAVCYLLDAAWCTGSILTVDGGLTAG